MIGIDTNIILRFMTRDDDRQFDLARKLVSAASAASPLCVNIVTLTEVVWVLEKRLSLPVERARGVARRFADAPEVYFSGDNPIHGWAEALASKHKGWTDVVVARINSELGCSHTYTFDKKAAKSVPGMELLA